MGAKEQVYNFIAAKVTSGEIKPDSHITEQYLADNLKMSRTPIREALLQLSVENVLEKEPRRGYRIKHYSQEDVEHLYELIGTIEGKIAEQTIDVITEDNCAMMNFLVDSMNSAINNRLYAKYNDLQEQFHDVYIRKSNNQFLRETLSHAKKIFIGKNYRRYSDKEIKTVLLRTNQEHVQIVVLIKGHRGRELRKYLEETHWNPQNAKYDIW